MEASLPRTEKMSHYQIRTFLAAVLFLSYPLIISAEEFEKAVVELGKRVQFHYTLKIDDQVIESSRETQPLEYIHGERKVIKGLSQAVEGMVVGEKKNIVIKPDQGYGYISQDSFREYNLNDLPEQVKPVLGMVVQLEIGEGQIAPGIVWEIREESFVVNFNHPLAGKTLEFDVEIVSVENVD